MKRIFTFLLALALLVSLLPPGALQVNAEAEDIILPAEATAPTDKPSQPASRASTTIGNCGDDLHYKYTTPDYKLTIYGTGPMWDYSPENPAPWEKHNFWKLEIQEGVTTIGDYAFADHSGKLSLLIPRSITRIGSNAFYDQFFSIRFIGGVIDIADDAFTSAQGTFSYISGWDEADRGTYGASHSQWEQVSLTKLSSSKLLYSLNEPLEPADFTFTAFTDDDQVTYQPLSVQIGSYDNSTPGEKTVTVTADENTFTHTYFVTDGDSYREQLRATVPMQYYDPNGATEDPTVTLGSITLKKDIHYTLTYNNYEKAGCDTSVTINGIGDLAGFTKTIPLTLLKVDISDYKCEVGTGEFTGAPLIPDITVHNGDHRGLTAGKDYVVYCENNTNMGTATYHVVGIGGYCGSITGTFKIGTLQRVPQLNGAYNGLLGGELDMDQYKYKEFFLAPRSYTFQIDSKVGSTVYPHRAAYQLYRINGDLSQLVTTYESPHGYKAVTQFTYDFTSVYEEDTGTGGVLYMLAYTWVDNRDRVFSGVAMLLFPAKVPDATMLVPEMVDVIDFRHGYATAYGPDGHLGPVTWSSSDPSIVSIEKDGVFTMHSLGDVTLTARSGDLEESILITVMAEDLSQGTIYDYDAATGKATVVYDGRILEEGTDYTLEAAQTGGLWEVAVTGTGVFQGQLIRYFDTNGEPVSHAHGFPSTCDALCIRCDLQREPETEHRYETQKDEETHWQTCIYCGAKKDEAPHIYVNGNSKLCSQCGEIPDAPQPPTYEYPPSDTDGTQLTQLPLPGSTVVLSFSGIAMGTDRAGIGFAPVPGKLTGDTLAVTDGMAQLQVRSEGDAYIFLQDGRYLTSGPLGNYLYYADSLSSYSRWYLEPAGNGSWNIVNMGTGLALTFAYAFTTAPVEDNPLCLLQLYQTAGLPQLPSNVTRLNTPTMLTEATNITDAEAYLAWTSVPYADSYEVYRATSKSGSYTKVATVYNTTYWEEVPSGKTYYYKVKAAYSGNTSKNSSFSTVVSYACRLPAPVVEMALNESTGRMVFTWKAVPGAKEYEIYRARSGQSYEKIATTSKLTYTDTKATPSITYTYVFRTLGSSGSYHSNTSQPYQCRHLLQTPKATIKLDSKLACPVVSWEPIAGARSYTIYHRYPGDTEFVFDTLYAGTTYTFSRAPADSLCQYRIMANPEESGDNDPTTYAEVSIVTGVATPTLNCHVAGGHIKATWEAVNGAVKYELYRSTSEKKGYTLLATLTDTLEYLDTDTPVGKKFYYKVVAVGNLSRSKDSHVTGIAAICKRPVVTAQRNEKGKPMLSWEKVEGAKQYTVYYGTVSYSMKKLGTTKSLSYTHTGAKAGTTYYYWVVANGPTSGSNSTSSIPVTCSVGSGTPVVSAKADAATGKPSLSWGKVAGAVKYRIYRQLPGEAEFSVLTEQTATSYLDSAVPIDTQCIYKVQALGKTTALDGDPSREISIASGIARPTLTATVDAVTGKPVFTWTAVEGAVTYELYRSTKSTKSYSLLTTLETPGYTDDSVAPGKTYYYKLVAVGNVGKSAETAYVKLTGKCATPTITVENGTTGKPVISWEKIAGAKKYTVYRATSETGKYTKLGTATKLTYTDSKAKAGSTYFYKIVANGSKSTYNSPYSNIVSCNVICGTPSVILKLDTSTGKPVLSWKKVDGATSYRILRQLPGEEDFTVIAEQTALTFKDETAPIDTLCKYMVQTLGKTEELHGGLTKVLEIASGIARPSLKTGLDAQGKPQLSWEPIEGAVKYEIYRSTKSTKSYKLLTTVEVPGYTDDSVAPGKTYYYKVVAIGQVSKSAETAYVKLTGKCATPEIAAEVDYFSGRPVISWQKVTGAKKYTVYRATSETGKYTKLGTTSKLTYTDTKATVGKTYFYKIVANASSSKYNSAYSNLVSCTPTCAVPAIKVATAAATGKPVLSWKKVTGAVVYEIWLEQAGAMEQLASTTQLTFTDESIVPGETKIYWVYAVDALGRKAGQWAVATATCPQPKPTGKAGETGKPELTWEAVEGATRYVIYRSTSKSKGYKAIDETDALTFTDISAAKGKTYYYKVAALCEETESAQSAYVKVTCKASSRPISYSTCKDKGSKTVWDFARFNGNRLDVYEERDASRSFFLQNLSAANGSMYYLEEEEMRMFVGKNYGMPIVTSRELAEATVWTSSDPTVATVNGVGFVTPLKEGTVTITATMPGEVPVMRTCLVHVINYPVHTYAELEAQAKVEAKRIADYVMAYPGLTTDMDHIALAAKIINELYVANGMGASLLEIKNGDIVETMIPGYNQPYGTLVTYHSSCAGDVRALGMVLEYMGFDWYHANADKWVHQWCIVYDVDGQTAFADGSMYGIAGYGERKEDGSNWLQFNGPLTPLN